MSLTVKSLLATECIVRAGIARIREPQHSMAEHVRRQFLECEAYSDPAKHNEVLEDLRDELADLGFAW